jgi:hypothetical protein
VKKLGAAQVTEVLPGWVYALRKVRVMHLSRLEFSAARGRGMAYEVAFIDDLRHTPDRHRWKVLVRWAGFEQSKSTWEPAQSLIEDTPDSVQKFLQLPREAREYLVALLRSVHT